MILTKRMLSQTFRKAKQENVDEFFFPLRRAMAAYSIDTPQRIAHFLAQVGHESGQLQYTEEIASGREYEGREDLGNTEKGDGVRFKGRGLIQLTGRYNYQEFANSIRLPELMKKPEMLAEPDLACLSAAWFWNKKNLNRLADEGNLEKITRRINGGTNGMQSRKKLYEDACAAIREEQS